MTRAFFFSHFDTLMAMSKCHLNYAVIAAAGHHGDWLSIYSAHKTAAAAKAAAAKYNRRSEVHRVRAVEYPCARTGMRFPRVETQGMSTLGRQARRRTRRRTRR